MNGPEEHVSIFELDLHFVTGGSDARIEAHVSGCRQCSAYLSALGGLQAGAALPALPQRPASPGSGAPAGAQPSRPRRLGLLLGAALSVLAAVTTRLVSRDDEPPAVAVKGGPAVQLLVRRGDQTRAWDGTSRVRPGDALGLRVACDDFRRVAVAAFSHERAGWQRISDEACPREAGAAAAALPFTLVVDDTPGRERFAVVFSPEPLDEHVLGLAIERRRLDAGAWVARFELDKEVSQ